MKGKWVNRNRYLSKQGIVSFTLPLKDASSYKKICNTEIDKNRYITWRDKLIRGLSQVYSNCPYKNDTLEVIAVFENTCWINLSDQYFCVNILINLTCSIKLF